MKKNDEIIGVATVTGKYFGTVSPYGGTDNSFTTTYNNGE